MFWPVVNVPASEARKTAAPAISSGIPILLRAEPLVADSKIVSFCHKAFEKSVLITPGDIQFALILFLPYSTAMFLANC